MPSHPDMPDPKAKSFSNRLRDLAKPEPSRAAGQAVGRLLSMSMDEAWIPPPAEESGAADRRLADLFSWGPAVRAVDRAIGELGADAPDVVGRLIVNARRSFGKLAAASASQDWREADRWNAVNVALSGSLAMMGPAAAVAADAIVAALAVDAKSGSVEAQVDEWLAESLSRMGPAIVRAVPKLLDLLARSMPQRKASKFGLALAAATSHDPTVVPALVQMLDAGASGARAGAAYALAAVGTATPDSAMPGLLRIAVAEGPLERAAGFAALAQVAPDTDDVAKAVERGMADPDELVRHHAVRSAGRLPRRAERFVPLLVRACDHPFSLPSVAEAAVRSLGDFGPAANAAANRLKKFLKKRKSMPEVSPEVVEDALRRIGR